MNTGNREDYCFECEAKQNKIRSLTTGITTCITKLEHIKSKTNDPEITKELNYLISSLEFEKIMAKN